MRYLFLLSLSFVVSCATSPNQNRSRLTYLGKQKKALQKRQEQQSFRQFVRRETRRKKIRANRSKVFELPKNLSEESLYSEVIKNYRVNKIEEVEFYVQEHLKRFPLSVYSDNAVHLLAQTYLKIRMPARALYQFEKILKNYPLGNKRGAALLGKGIAYRQMKIFKYSEKALKEVRRQYPGSPESFKADFELKVLKAQRG